MPVPAFHSSRARVDVACGLAIFLSLAVTAARSQAAPDITSVNIFQQTVADSDKQNFIIEIKGTALDTHDLRVLVFPASGVEGLQTLPAAAADAPTTLRIRFTAAGSYAPEEVAISWPGSSFKAFKTGKTQCDLQHDVKPVADVLSKDQAKDKYGNGIAANFYVVQLSILNDCSTAVTVPLAGIKIVPKTEEAANPIAPASLDHVTSLYSADRKLTGTRAIFFNLLQALATLGSAVEPFFARGFTQGVSIWGGGFTQAWQTVLKDMSAEQLQNLTSQSLGSNEKIAANGPLQKFIFVPSQCGGPTFFHHWKKKSCRQLPVEQALMSGAFDVEMQFVPTSAQAGTVKAQASVAKVPKKTK